MSRNPDKRAKMPADYKGGITDGDLTDPMDLRDFLVGVGHVMQLSPKDEQAPIAPPRGETHRRVGWSSAILPLVALLLGFGLVWGSTTLKGRGALPGEVIGVWQTTEPRYVDRSFTLQPDSVVFQVGPSAEQYTIYPIHGIKTSRSADTTQVTVDYLADGESMSFAFEYTTLPEPTIRFHNQPEFAWQRRR